jgi:small ligand-binding sensory domain FIST
MSDKKISDLTNVAAANITGAEEIAIVQSSETKKSNLTNVQSFIVNHLDPTALTVSVAGGTIDLNDTAYDEAELIVLTWSGGNGTVELTLPDATEAKNLNRSKRIISDSSFNTATHADLTPRAGQTLDGSSSAFRINKAYEGIKIWCNGTEWFIIQAKA